MFPIVECIQRQSPWLSSRPLLLFLPLLGCPATRPESAILDCSRNQGVLSVMAIFQQPSRTSADIDRKITFPLRSSSVAKAIKFIGIAILLLSSSVFWLLAFRFVSLPFLISSWVLFHGISSSSESGVCPKFLGIY
jgi:hypothetical protein